MGASRAIGKIVDASLDMKRDVADAATKLRELVSDLARALHTTLQPALAQVWCRASAGAAAPAAPIRVLLHLPASPGWQVAAQTAAAVMEALAAALAEPEESAAGAACGKEGVRLQLLLAAGGASEAEETAAEAAEADWLPVKLRQHGDVDAAAAAAKQRLNAALHAGNLEWLHDWQGLSEAKEVVHRASQFPWPRVEEIAKDMGEVAGERRQPRLCVLCHVGACACRCCRE